MVALQTLLSAADEVLEAARFKDYCPNGLQVEGRAEVRRLVTGVTASQALLEAAVDWQADAVLVHHGYFWRGEDARVIGMKQRRLSLLLRHDISLIAYHLPLDAHPGLGNNAQLAARLGLIAEGPLAPWDTSVVGNAGRLDAPCTAGEFAARVARALGREPLLVGDAARPLRRVGWCTGAAQGYIEHAVAQGLDAYITGEVSEQTVHVAREAGIAFFAAGHHATERYGVQALGDWLAERFALEHRFVDIDNPV